MQDPKWGAFEFALQDYLRENFLNSSMKREDEFNTMWNVAFTEGGKYYLNDFINKLEQYSNYD